MNVSNAKLITLLPNSLNTRVVETKCIFVSNFKVTLLLSVGLQFLILQSLIKADSHYDLMCYT